MPACHGRVDKLLAGLYKLSASGACTRHSNLLLILSLNSTLNLTLARL